MVQRICVPARLPIRKVSDFATWRLARTHSSSLLGQGTVARGIDTSRTCGLHGVGAMTSDPGVYRGLRHLCHALRTSSLFAGRRPTSYPLPSRARREASDLEGDVLEVRRGNRPAWSVVHGSALALCSSRKPRASLIALSLRPPSCGSARPRATTSTLQFPSEPQLDRCARPTRDEITALT